LQGATALFGFNLGFNHREVALRMRIEILVSESQVAWLCEGDVDEWKGTRLRFEIIPAEEETVTLKLTHSGWRSTEGAFQVCNADRERLMYYLNDYVESRGQVPMMS
jgi:hypothetical protein